MKEKIIIVLSVAVAIVLCITGIYFLDNYEARYYTQIDNRKLAAVSATDDMRYEYTLECCNARGKTKELKFKTARELREGAYLMLTVKSFGVHAWQEVGYDELPEKARSLFPAPPSAPAQTSTGKYL